MATLAVVGASPLFRAGLVSLLKSMNFDRVQDGANLAELKRSVDVLGSPEILLTKIPYSTDAIPSFLKEIWSYFPNTKVVFLASDFDLNMLSACFSSGASGYILDDISSDSFIESLRLVFSGEKVFPSGLANVISDFASKNPLGAGSLSDLTQFHLSDREIEILRCLSVGQSNKMIAKTLCIAESTVKVHVKRILHKTHATNRTQAALWGAARGLMPISKTAPDPKP